MTRASINQRLDTALAEAAKLQTTFDNILNHKQGYWWGYVAPQCQHPSVCTSKSVAFLEGEPNMWLCGDHFNLETNSEDLL